MQSIDTVDIKSSRRSKHDFRVRGTMSDVMSLGRKVMTPS